MQSLKLLEHLKNKYAEGQNIIAYLKQLKQIELTTTEDILISYDFQAGSYIYYATRDDQQKNFCEKLFHVLEKLGKFDTILEVGVGEATTLGFLLKFLPQSLKAWGFDISWSRVKYAQKFLDQIDTSQQTGLFTGDLFEAPLQDSSIDIVYTSHSLEPNGGREKEGLEELYRIASQYVVLLEPGYEFASESGKARMEKHGYVQNLYQHAKELGYKVIEHRPFDVSITESNPTALTIIEKQNVKKDIQNLPLGCPLTKTPLKLLNGCYYSEQSLLSYPIIAEIPCLLSQNAIISTHFMDFIQE